MNNDNEWLKLSEKVSLNNADDKTPTSQDEPKILSSRVVNTRKNKGEENRLLSGLSRAKQWFISVATIVFLFIALFVALSWGEIDSFSRIVVSLGMGILFTGLGSVLLKQKPEDHIDIGTALHAVGGLLMPIGIFVTMSEFGADPTSFWTTSTVFGFVFAFYLLLSYVHRRTVIYFFTIAHGTASIYLLTEALTQNMDNQNIYLYLNVFIGGVYLLLSYYFRNSWNDKLLGTLNLFGSTGVFGFAFMLLMQSQLWEGIYAVLVLLAFFLATRMKSIVILMVSTLSIIAYTAFMLNKYLATELGLPALVLLLVALSLIYIYIYTVINNKYIKN